MCPRDFRRGEMEEIMKKRILAILLIVSLFTTMFVTTVSATENEGELLQSQIFTPNGQQSNAPYKSPALAPAYQPGTIKIDDYLHPSSGIYNSDYKTVTGQAAKDTAVVIISNIPGIGNVISDVGSIVGLMSSYNSALNSVDYSKTTTVSTRYSFRNFTHYLKAYTHNYTWKDVGSSLSRYYYKHIYITAYSKTKGDYVTESEDFTHSNGYAPERIAEAPNYKNYSVLTNRAYEAYIYNRSYRETY